MEFGKIFRKLREERGVTQEQLAKAFGYKNNSYIARIERGDFLPEREKLKKMAEILKVPFSYLDGLLLEAKMREFGIKRADLLALFRDIPHLPEREKRAIINAYLKVKERMKKKKKS